MPLDYLGSNSETPGSSSRRRQVREFTPARTELPAGSSRPRNEASASASRQQEASWGFEGLSLGHGRSTHSSTPRGQTHAPTSRAPSTNRTATSRTPATTRTPATSRTTAQKDSSSGFESRRLGPHGDSTHSATPRQTHTQGTTRTQATSRTPATNRTESTTRTQATSRTSATNRTESTSRTQATSRNTTTSRTTATSHSLPDFETLIQKHLVPATVKAGDDECIICTSEFDTGKHQAVKVKSNPACGHYWGRECILIWFHSQRETSNRCPVCRQELFKINDAMIKHSRANMDGILPEEDWLRQEHGVVRSRSLIDRPQSTPEWEKRLKRQTCEEHASYLREVGRPHEIPSRWRPAPDAAKARWLLQEGRDLIRHFNNRKILFFNYDGDKVIDPDAPIGRRVAFTSTPHGRPWSGEPTSRTTSRSTSRTTSRTATTSLRSDPVASVSRPSYWAGTDVPIADDAWVRRLKAQRHAEIDWYGVEPDADKKRSLLAEGKALVKVFGKEAFVFDYSGNQIIVPDASQLR